MPKNIHFGPKIDPNHQNTSNPIFFVKLIYQVSVNGCNLGTNSEKIISYQKNIIFNGFIVLGGVKSIGIINFGKIFAIVLVYYL